MTREEIVKVINDDPHLTAEQAEAIMERYKDCMHHIHEEIFSIVTQKDLKPNVTIALIKEISFMIGYVYASLELKGKVEL